MSEVDVEQLRIAVLRLERKVDEIINYLNSQFGNIEFDFSIKSIYDEKGEAWEQLQSLATKVNDVE